MTEFINFGWRRVALVNPYYDPKKIILVDAPSVTAKGGKRYVTWYEIEADIDSNNWDCFAVVDTDGVVLADSIRRNEGATLSDGEKLWLIGYLKEKAVRPVFVRRLPESD